MGAAGGPIYGIAGTLSAFPRRLAAREVARQGGSLRGGAGRGVTHLVLGRKLLDRAGAEELETRVAKAADRGVRVLSENGFRRALGLLPRSADATLSRSSLVEQSRLDGRTIDMLSLFDAFEQDGEPYSFRDVILARKYRSLVEAGTSWLDIARSVHRVGDVASLTALALHGGGRAVYRKDGNRLSEIDGQGLLFTDEGPDADELFAAAEAAEADGDCEAAASLYGRYLALVPNDSVAAFNRANALRAAERRDDAADAYVVAIKLDPGFAEAWFNHGSLLRELGKTDAARAHFAKAVALDPEYADPVYSLAALEYEAGELIEARRHWARYLELDPKSDWAKKATRGIQLIDMTLNAERKRGA